MSTKRKNGEEEVGGSDPQPKKSARRRKQTNKVDFDKDRGEELSIRDLMESIATRLDKLESQQDGSSNKNHRSKAPATVSNPEKASQKDSVKDNSVVSDHEDGEIEDEDTQDDLALPNLRQSTAKEAKKDRITSGSDKVSLSGSSALQSPQQPLQPVTPDPRALFAPAKPASWGIQNEEGNDTVMASAMIASQLSGMIGRNEQSSAISEFLVIGATVDPKIKAKIWEGAYVELGSLIPRQDKKPKMEMSCGTNSQFTLTPARHKQPSTIQEWTDWFATYACIYCEKYPFASSQMFSYLVRIREMHDVERALHGNSFTWRAYDEEFRKVKACKPSMEWHTVENTIERAAKKADVIRYGGGKFQGQNNNKRFQGQNQRKKSSYKSTIKGTCDLFNTSKCPYKPCKYLHFCGYCRGSHPASQCRQQTGAQSQESSKQ